MRELVQRSHGLVFEKLPAAQRRKLDAPGDAPVTAKKASAKAATKKASAKVATSKKAATKRATVKKASEAGGGARRVVSKAKPGARRPTKG